MFEQNKDWQSGDKTSLLWKSFSKQQTREVFVHLIVIPLVLFNFNENNFGVKKKIFE